MSHVQIFSFVLAFLSTVSCVVTCAWNQWAISSAVGSKTLLHTVWAFKGLWCECMQIMTYQYQCENYLVPLFELPVYLNVLRAFMVTANVVSIIGCFCLLIGMECSKLLDSDPDAKRRIMRIAGSLFLIAGLLTLASVVWYTSIVIYDFFSIYSQDNIIRFELGATLYLGYISSVLSAGAGIFCICVPGKKADDEIDNQIYLFNRGEISYSSSKKKKFSEPEYI